MKKRLTFLLTMICILGLCGCSPKQAVQPSGNKLTLDKVVELSAKGEALSWSDFESYESVDTGSGLYILTYDIDDMFTLYIGGGSLDEPPMYMCLMSKKNPDSIIDIRSGDVQAFIEMVKITDSAILR